MKRKNDREHNPLLKQAWVWGTLLTIVVAVIGLTPAAAAQTEQNPTPAMIQLTPDATVTIAATATMAATETPILTVTPEFVPDRFEPNNSAETAASLNEQQLQGLTLIDDDVDFFAGELTAGQSVQLRAIGHDGLTLHTTLFWQGSIVGETTYTASEAGRFVLEVRKTSTASGRYDLQFTYSKPMETPTPTATATTAAAATDVVAPTSTLPTASILPTQRPTETAIPPTPIKVWPTPPIHHWPTHTPTPQPIWPTPTPSPTATTPWPTLTATTVPPTATRFWPTHTPTVQPIWPTATPKTVHQPTKQIAAEAVIQPAAVSNTQLSAETPNLTSTATPTTSVSLTATAALTSAQAIPLTIRSLGRAESASATVTTPPATTTVRILVYYDANNDRAPSPNEGIPNVSVLAVDGRGQQLAHIFTNAQGEAVIILTDATAARIIVPFVPNWSARIRPGQQNEPIVLGLPAVRLPVFLPVQNSADVNEE